MNEQQAKEWMRQYLPNMPSYSMLPDFLVLSSSYLWTPAMQAGPMLTKEETLVLARWAKEVIAEQQHGSTP